MLLVHGLGPADQALERARTIKDTGVQRGEVSNRVQIKETNNRKRKRKRKKKKEKKGRKKESEKKEKKPVQEPSRRIPEPRKPARNLLEGSQNRNWQLYVHL